jgi:hypothetical protein
MKDNSSYSLQEVAEKLNISRSNLLILLRRYNIVSGMKAAPEFILQGYFIQHSKLVENGNFKKKADIIIVSGAGLKWLKAVMAVFENKMKNWI